MTQRNKLYKHHKSKAFFVIRNFSFVLFGFASLAAVVAVPTYISTIQEKQIEAKATSENDKKEVDSDLEESELLSIL